jgi:hypothetical protein
MQKHIFQIAAIAVFSNQCIRSSLYNQPALIDNGYLTADGLGFFQ